MTIPHDTSQGTESHFRALAEISSDGLVVIASDGYLRYVNPATTAILGYTLEDLRALETFGFVHPEDLKNNVDYFMHLLEHGHTDALLEYRAYHKDGHIINIEAHGRLVDNGDVIGFLRDVTQQKKVEKALRESEEKYRTLIETSPDAVVTFTQEGEFTYISPSFTALFGYDENDVKTMQALDIVHPDDLKTAKATLGQLFSREVEYTRMQYRFIHKDGEIRHVEGFGRLLPNGSIVGFISDITGRVRTQEELEQGESRYRTLIETYTDGVMVLDPEGKLLYANPAFERLYGYDANAYVGYLFSDFLEFGDDRALQIFAHLVQNPGETVHFDNIPFRHGDGTIRLIDGTARVMPDGKIVGFSRDVTQRRFEENALRSIVEGTSNLTGDDFFQSFVKHLAMALHVKYAYVTRVSQTREEYAETLAFWGDGEFRTNCHYPLTGTPCRHVWTNGFCYYPEKVQQLFPDDSMLKEINAESYMGIPLKSSTGQIIGHIAVMDDKLINDEETRKRILQIFAARAGAEMERLQTEQALIQLNSQLERLVEERTAELAVTSAQQRRLAAIIEATTDYVGIADLEGWSLYVNHHGRAMVGRTGEDLGVLYNVSNCHPEREHAKLGEMVRRAIEGKSTSGETVLLGENGREIPVSFVSVPLCDTNGQVEAIAAIMRDVSMQKQVEAEMQQAKDTAEAALEQSKRLSKIMEATTDLVAMIKPDGTGEYLNKAGYTLLGIPEDIDIRTLNLMNYYPPEVLEFLMTEAIPAALRDGAWSGESIILNHSGTPIPLSQVGLVMTNPNGEIDYLATISRDLTERKRFEEELKQAKNAAEAALGESRQLSAIIEATPDVIGITDMEGYQMYMNQTAREVVGIRPDESLREVHMFEFFTPESRSLLEEVGIPYAVENGVWSGEVDLKSRDGKITTMSMVGIVHYSPDGTPMSMSGTMRDISERKRFETELKKAKDSAEAANRAKSTFLANMSHEIRTPMNAIIGMTSLLLDTSLQAKQRDFIETIRTSGDSLLTIINDILDFSKIEAERLELVYRPLDLRECVESALDLLAPIASEKHIDLAYIIEQQVPHTIIADGTRLRQIIVNLLSNAVKFTEQGEVVIYVSAKKLPRKGDNMHEILFSVRDTGIGIVKDKMDRLFKPFSQVDASTTREYGGTGLGLAISKRLSEMMGGRTWAESTGIPGKGTTFYFSIVAESTQSRQHTFLQLQQPELQGKRVLIVDDNATNRRILTLQVETWGLIPYTAALPGEALMLLESGETFDLAILDMHMPQMNGQELAVEMRKLPTGRALPLVMLTSLSQSDTGEMFAAFLTKPVKPSELYNLLMSLFAREVPVKQVPLKRNDKQDQSVEDNPKLLAQEMPLRILLAEDVLVNQKFAVHALDQMGYRVDVVANGLEALEAVERQHYDLILMDVQMPHMDGLEATRQIRRLNTPQPQIVAMTANAMQGDRELCIDAGMDDYISKPVHLPELRAALKRAGGRLPHNRDNAHEAVDVIEPVLPVIEQIKSFGEDIVEAFISEIPHTLDILKQAIQADDVATIAAEAHKLKGSSAYMGLDRVRGLATQLENAARIVNLPHIQLLFDELHTELRQIIEQLLK